MSQDLTAKEQADKLFKKFVDLGCSGQEAIQYSLVCVETVSNARLEKAKDLLYWIEVRIELNKLWKINPKTS